MLFLTILKSIFGKVLGSWQWLLTVFLIVLVAFAGYKYYELGKHAKTLKASLDVETYANRVLRDNNATLTAASQQKDGTIQQLQSDKALLEKTLLDMNTKIIAANKTVSDYKKALDSIRSEPAPNKSEYINKALAGVRQINGETK